MVKIVLYHHICLEKSFYGVNLTEVQRKRVCLSLSFLETVMFVTLEFLHTMAYAREKHSVIKGQECCVEW